MQQTDLLIQSTTSQQSTPRHDTKIQKYTSSSVVHRRLDFHRPPQKRLNEWHSSASFLAKVEPTTEGDSPSVPHYCGTVSPTIVEMCPPLLWAPIHLLLCRIPLCPSPSQSGHRCSHPCRVFDTQLHLCGTRKGFLFPHHPPPPVPLGFGELLVSSAV